MEYLADSFWKDKGKICKVAIFTRIAKEPWETNAYIVTKFANIKCGDIFRVINPDGQWHDKFLWKAETDADDTRPPCKFYHPFIPQ